MWRDSARYWLFTLPVQIVDLWFTAYRLLLVVITIVSVTTVMASLLLAAFGVRWGW